MVINISLKALSLDVPMIKPESEGKISNFSSSILGANAASPPIISVSTQAPNTIRVNVGIRI